MMFMIILPETKPQNTTTAVAPELIGICPNQPCNPSVLSLSYIINASWISMSRWPLTFQHKISQYL